MCKGEWSRVFHIIFGGGLAFEDGVRWGGLMLGTKSDEGDLDKLSAEAKNGPLQQN